ncbi:MAG: tRNA-guanine transglycosylase, partial [Oscillospiraceae bacterium]|jgi:queuine tRNA-ribosyltransferase|nr:tRNA-guanine transglycosylase [Oscillospiraceae bacterium]
VFSRNGRINLRNAKYTRDFSPIDEDCDCPTCRGFSRAYLRHLFVAGEMLGAMLASAHNLRFLLRMMEEIRAAIENDTLSEYRRLFYERYDLTKRF